MEASAVIKKEDGVETAKICRWCRSSGNALVALTRDESGQFTGLQIEFSPGVPSYLCTMCGSRLEKQNTAKNGADISKDQLGHSVGTELLIKTEVTTPDGTHECCGQQPFEAEENPITIELEYVDVDELNRLPTNATLDHELDDLQTNPLELVCQDREDHSMSNNMCADGTELLIKTEVSTPDAALDLHLNQKNCTAHEANWTYECSGHIPDDSFEPEENPIAIKSEDEEIDEQQQLQTTNDVLNHEQDNQKINPLESIYHDHPWQTVADNTCADDSAVESIHEANWIYEYSGHIPDDLFEAEGNPIAIKSEDEEIDDQQQLQITTDVLDHEQDDQKINPLESIYHDHPWHTVADNTCADDSAVESIQNDLSLGTQNAHSKSHSKNHKHHCPRCSTTYPSLSMLKEHIRTHTSERPFQCKVCDKAFHSSGNLAAHSKIHNKDQQHQCPYCSSMFAPSYLKVHIRTHTGEKPYKCTICDKAFYSSSKLAAHSKIHNKDQYSKCPYCSSMFAPSYLKVHIRSHTGEKPYKCTGCDKAFCSSGMLAQHSKIHNKDQNYQCPRTHTGERPYVCKVCDKAFHSSLKLAEHQKIHNKDQQDQCPHCSSMFAQLSNLKIHIRTHTGEKPYKCTICDKACMYECCGNQVDDLFEAEENPIAIKSEYEEDDEQHEMQTTNDVLDHEQDKRNPLESICQDQKNHPVIVSAAAESTQNVLSPGTRDAHTKSHSNNHKHHCPHCSATYPALNKLKLHIRSHTGQKSYQCKICDKAFRGSNSLAVHSKIHNKDQQHQCPHCSSKFTRLFSLKIHIRTHTGERPYQCKVCDKAFHSSRILSEHSKTHNKDQQHRCPHCSATYPALNKLKLHIRTHTGQKSYQCKICDKAFSSLGILTQHSKIHNKDKPHQCPHCSSKFSRLLALKIHIRTHTGERPYQCKVCDKTFRSSSIMTQHSKIHNKDKQHQCPHCSSMFAQSSNLKNHIRVHTGERPFKCKFCDKAFRSLSNLMYHYKKHHKGETC